MQASSLLGLEILVLLVGVAIVTCAYVLKRKKKCPPENTRQGQLEHSPAELEPELAEGLVQCIRNTEREKAQSILIRLITSGVAFDVLR